jgi:hypothetical protein
MVGDAAVPETLAVPLDAAVKRLHVSWVATLESPSVATMDGVDHAVGLPSSDIVTATESPWVMTGGSLALTMMVTVLGTGLEAAVAHFVGKGLGRGTGGSCVVSERTVGVESKVSVCGVTRDKGA